MNPFKDIPVLSPDLSAYYGYTSTQDWLEHKAQLAKLIK